MKTQPPFITSDRKGIAFTNRKEEAEEAEKAEKAEKAVHVHLDDNTKEEIWSAFMDYVELKEGQRRTDPLPEDTKEEIWSRFMQYVDLKESHHV